jgi:hypothetical protein
MTPLNEKLLIKEATIHKYLYDKEWFFYLEDLKHFLNEDLSSVEFIFLPIIIEGEEEFVKCATFEDIIRGRKES